MVIKTNEELWVTNISGTQDLSISDLRITIRHGSSINLLATNKRGKFLYNFTKQDIEKSLKDGSLFKKSNLLKVRRISPIVLNHRIDVANSGGRPSSRLNRKATEIETFEYPDLDFEEDESVEKFAEQTADLDFEDRRPALVVDPKYNE